MSFLVVSSEGRSNSFALKESVTDEQVLQVVRDMKQTKDYKNFPYSGLSMLWSKYSPLGANAVYHFDYDYNYLTKKGSYDDGFSPVEVRDFVGKIVKFKYNGTTRLVKVSEQNNKYLKGVDLTDEAAGGKFKNFLIRNVQGDIQEVNL